MSREYISDKVKLILSGEDSPFMQLLALAAKYDNVITLGRGDPDLPTPKHVVDAAINALENGQTKYTTPVGLIELRQAIAEKYMKEHRIAYDPESEVIVTSGTQEAIFVTMQSLLNTGDEMLIPEPYYACYAESAKLAGAKVVAAPTSVENNFEVTAEAIASKITSKTKVLALISPSNPSGTVVPRETLEKIAKLVLKHDLIVVSDELYENIMYDGKKPTCFASLPGMREHTVVINGFSKAYCMTGLRVGYMVGPKKIIKPVSVPHHAMIICANSVAQRAALAAIIGPQDFIEEYRDLYDVRRRIVMDVLDAGGVGYARPSGGFFVFADVRKSGMNSFEFCKGLLEAEQVQVFPGTMYGEGADGFVRISFLAEKAVLKDAVERFVKYYKTLIK
jgi:aspartate/methionine/tyrosine aminotransferase